VSEDEEQDRDASREVEVEVEQDTKKTMNSFNSRFYYKAISSS